MYYQVFGQKAYRLLGHTELVWKDFNVVVESEYIGKSICQAVCERLEIESENLNIINILDIANPEFKDVVNLKLKKHTKEDLLTPIWNSINEYLVSQGFVKQDFLWDCWKLNLKDLKVNISIFYENDSYTLDVTAYSRYLPSRTYKHQIKDVNFETLLQDIKQILQEIGEAL